MKILIYSGVFCQNEENRETVKLWGRLTAHLNPDIDIMVFDSCSPFNPDYFLPNRIHIHHFTDNPGHLSQGGRDGAGRTFCAGIEYAHEQGYDYAIHLESDMLLARPLRALIEKMAAAGVKAAACFIPQYQFFEYGICAMHIPTMVEKKFFDRYDWENSPKWPIPERRLGELLGDDLFIIPWFGARNDQHQIHPHTLAQAFPYSPADFLTHCSLELAMAFLEMNQITLPEEE